ncbi:hypothetical protein DSM03_11813 [Leeuwenhoekiella aestuarii]|uniref:Uncharacterized protein n=1 Tax=Leeuwenhoekiella aestuarii TaxID=2249426 RepID=A0A4Q0NNY0_9FLAO|nr:hypothetical protein [Leeuwenhoekiella aestuarii]RXG11345.1 hypothetical protein DSM03_11813 [Leeuwenhoekiella aestuarii]RXG11768.1 hypothetical protein DSM04_10994 [Leeuwenhoekiella aestuarii]
MRKLASLFCLLFVLIKCEKAPTTDTSLLHLIPQKSAAIIRVPYWEDFSESIKANDPANLLSETNLNQTLVEYSELFKNFKPVDETYLSFVALGDNDYDLALITESNPKLVSKDSVFINSISTYDYEGVSINTITIHDTPLHYLNYNSIFIASTSKLILENAILQNNTGRDPIDTSLEKMIKTSNAQRANLYLKGSRFKKLFRTIIPKFKFSSNTTPFEWLAVDIDLNTVESLQLNGVATTSNDGKQVLDLLKNMDPAKSKIASITPSTSRGFISFNYSDWETYHTNLAIYKKAAPKAFKIPFTEYFQSTTETGIIYKENEQLIVSLSSDVETSTISLASVSTEKENFRDIPIYAISDSTFLQKAFGELLDPPAVQFYSAIDSYFVFAKNSTLLKDLIANYQNEAVLANTSSFVAFASKMSDESTLSFYGNTKHLADYISEKVDKKEAATLKNIDFKNYPESFLQLIQADDFTYLNAAVHKINQKKEAAQVVQVASVKLDNDLLSPPQMLKNYRTKGQDILVQDISNILYRINSSGKIEWKKELDGPVLGNIKQVDLYKNGRLQYAFTTPSHFYIIASDGDLVKPFDIDYTDKITQPLAVFDYDGSRDYRFLIVQNDKVTMLDREAKKVDGFLYKKASAEILQEAQHIRLGNKDYILFQLKSGKLEILNRRGETRIPLKEQFTFSNNPVFEDSNSFLVLETDGTPVTISQSGKITRQKPKLGAGFQFDKLNKSEASLIENKLIINKRNQEIALGIYTGLQVKKASNKYYICITDLQEKRVLIYDDKGNLLPSFPVYGASKIDFGSLKSSKDFGFTTQGESDSVIIYQMN